MPRKGHIPKREAIADPIYNSTLVTKFVNTMMWGGKRSTAQGIFYKSMQNLESKGGDGALKLFTKAVENTKPLLEVKTRRVGGRSEERRVGKECRSRWPEDLSCQHRVTSRPASFAWASGSMTPPALSIATSWRSCARQSTAWPTQVHASRMYIRR